MKKYNSILLLFIFGLFFNGSCEHKEGQHFIIQNNSDLEIVIEFDKSSIAKNTRCVINQNVVTRREYQDFIFARMIRPRSYKNFEKIKVGESLISRPNDTLYVGVFYRADIDTMSCEEFEQQFPLKKEWKITMADMEAADWTLVYTPEE